MYVKLKFGMASQRYTEVRPLPCSDAQTVLNDKTVEKTVEYI